MLEQIACFSYYLLRIRRGSFSDQRCRVSRSIIRTPPGVCEPAAATRAAAVRLVSDLAHRKPDTVARNTLISKGVCVQRTAVKLEDVAASPTSRSAKGCGISELKTVRGLMRGVTDELHQAGSLLKVRGMKAVFSHQALECRTSHACQARGFSYVAAGFVEQLTQLSGLKPFDDLLLLSLEVERT